MPNSDFKSSNRLQTTAEGSACLSEVCYFNVQVNKTQERIMTDGSKTFHTKTTYQSSIARLFNIEDVFIYSITRQHTQAKTCKCSEWDDKVWLRPENETNV